MADDTPEAEGGAGDETATAKKKRKKKASPAPRPGAPHLALRIALGTAGLLMVIGFFLPWLKLEDLATVSGMQLVIDDNPVIRALVGDDTQRWLLLVIPGFGLALTAVGFLGVRYSGHIAAVMGLLIVLYGVITMILFLFQKTGLGLWLIVIGAIVAVAAGTFAWARSRAASAQRKTDEAAADKLAL